MENIENLNGVDYSINSNDLIIDDMVSDSQELNQILAS